MKITATRALAGVFCAATLLAYGCSAASTHGVIKSGGSSGASAAASVSSAASSPQSGSASQSPSQPAVSAQDADAAKTLCAQAVGLYMGGNDDEAIKRCDEAIAKDPTNCDAYNIKGIALCFEKDYTNGMALINKSLSMKPNYIYGTFNMAMAYKLQKDYDNSLVWFRKVLAISPEDTWSFYGIATIYGDWGDTNEAMAYLRRAIELDPSVKETAKEQNDHWGNYHNNAVWRSLVGA